MSQLFNVAVAGATGAVGSQMLACLEERNFPVKEIRCLATAKSAGSRLRFSQQETVVEELTESSFKGVDIAIFSAGGTTSQQFAPAAARDGCIVVDNSAAWRMDPEVPLVIPEVNPHAVAGYTNKGIIANPNCSTIQMIVALAPIHRKVGIKRIVVSTYQAVSGTGRKAIDELRNQTKALVSGAACENKVYPYQIAFNCLPHIDVFLEDGYTKEEMKMVYETRKILEDDTIGITATAVRVPVYFGHSESVNIETIKPIGPEEVRSLLQASPGITVVDDPSNNLYPMAIDVEGKDDTFVGRIRADDSIANGINMWIVSNNIRKGAATNAVQIAEILARQYLGRP